MKEATGELNAAVIVAIIVAMLSLFFFGYLWPSIQANLDNNTACDEAICKCNDTPYEGGVCKNYTCHVKGSTKEITCAWKG